jgi:hypothetical protein
MKNMFGLVVMAAACFTARPGLAEPSKDASAREAEMRQALGVLQQVIDAALRQDTPAQDAPRLLAEAVRSGVADTEAVGAIMRWVLTEKEDKVADGFIAALGPLEAAAAGEQGQRWNPTARAMVDLFRSVLGDARNWRRHGGDAAASNVVTAAAPAVAEALRQADPAARETLERALRLAAPAAREIVPALTQALRHADASVRLGAVSALGALGPAARAAASDLSALLQDADPAVREAAARALKQVQGE